MPSMPMEETMQSASSELKKTVYFAGAGAGKTTTVVSEVLNFATRFKEKNRRWPKIVVTTFTIKATHELRERLTAEALKRKNIELSAFTADKQDLHISTIHGVLSLFLSQLGHKFGIDTRFRVIEDTENLKMARVALRELLLENSSFRELLSTFSFEQLIEGMLLAAQNLTLHGTARCYDIKDVELIYGRYISDLIENLAGLVKILSLDLEKTPPQDKRVQKWITFKNDLNHFYLELDSARGDHWSKIKDIFDKNILDLKIPALREDSPVTQVYKEAQKEFFKELEILESGIFDPQFVEESLRKQESLGALAFAFSERWRALKRDSGVLSIGDLETEALRGIRQVSWVSEEFSKQWDIWFIDEFQDTSPVQVELFKSLIGPKASVLVGDPQQSIYFFRGARSEIFSAEVKSVEGVEGALRELKTNYRSRPELLSFMNDFFSSRGFRPMLPKAPNFDSGQVVAFFNSSTSFEEEVECMIRHIRFLRSQGVSFKEICILGRTNKVLRDITQAFEKVGIPTQLNVASGFFERREILDALSFLRFLVNPQDDFNFVELLRSPWITITDSEIFDLVSPLRHNFWQSLKERTDVAGLKALRDIQENSRDVGILSAFEMALVKIGLFDSSRSFDPSGRIEANLWKLIALLRQESHRPGFSFNEFLKKSSMSKYDEESNEADAIPIVDPDRLNLMTIHQSKGLKFGHVILPGTNKPPMQKPFEPVYFDEQEARWSWAVVNPRVSKQSHLLPGVLIKKKIRKSEVEESDRLLYVAVTRAEQSVYFSSNSKAGKESWAERFEIDFSGEKYSKSDRYKVQASNSRDEAGVPVPMTSENVSQPAEVQDPFRPPSSPKHKIHSVTEILESGTKYVRHQRGKPVEMSASLQKRALGTAIHKLFELRKYHSFEKMSFVNSESLAVLKRTFEMSKVPFEKIFETGFAEWSFVVKDSLLNLQGQIDLWGDVGHDVWIVDYKTGNPEFGRKALDQLQIYAWALRKFGVSKPIRLAAVFTFEDKEFIEDALESEAVEKKYFAHL